MNAADLILDVEALIFASEQALSIRQISDYLHNAYEEEIGEELLADAVDTIMKKYNEPHYPFEIRQVGGGYQFLTKPSHHRVIVQMNGDKYNKRLSATAMETLAIIAYRQPITKSEIEHIRGVSSDYAIHKLLEKELIIISGRDEEAIGKPILYATSGEFFDFLGINDKQGLPELKELNTELLVMPTDASEALPDDMNQDLPDEEDTAAISNLSVGDDGELRRMNGNTN